MTNFSAKAQMAQNRNETNFLYLKGKVEMRQEGRDGVMEEQREGEIRKQRQGKGNNNLR